MMDEGGKATALAMIETIDEKLLSATSLNKAGYYNDSLSRSYCAAFHSVSMLFFLPGRFFRSHGQTLWAGQTGVTGSSLPRSPTENQSPSISVWLSPVA
ncbi:MAG: hypothetical protein WCQ50_15765, partial [Spirochaetota bacterium]